MAPEHLKCGQDSWKTEFLTSGYTIGECRPGIYVLHEEELQAGNVGGERRSKDDSKFLAWAALRGPAMKIQPEV